MVNMVEDITSKHWVMIVAIIAASIVIYEFGESAMSIAAAKAGLQQCVDGTHVVWQKECKK